MHRTFAGWALAGLAVLILASPAQGKPQEARQDSGQPQGTAPAPPPPPPPSTSAPPPPTTTSAPPPAPAAQAIGRDSSDRTVIAESRQRSGRSGARSGGERRGSGGGSVASPRGSGGASSTASTEAERSDDRERRATRRSDRPRDDRASIGTAVARTRPRARPVVIPSWAWGRPSYWYGYNSLGLGYFYYDPYWWGYPGYGYGHGYGYGAGYATHYRDYDYFDRGQLRLKVKPRDAEVRVDGYFVGTVDEFDGVFQRLTLESGPHRVEIRNPGYQPLVFDVRILPDETVTYRGELREEP
jgi:hypothetical protein